MSGSYKDENVELFFKDAILFGIYQPPVVTLDVAQKAVKQRLTFSEGKTYRVLIDIRRIKSVTAEARKFLAEPYCFDGISIAAIVVNNIFQETIGNIYIYLSKHPVPLKLFRSEKDAMNWLKE